MSVGEMNTEIDRLMAHRPDLADEYGRDMTAVERLREAIMVGPFPGIGAGDPDLSEAFAWRAWCLSASERGAIGVVLPRSVFVSAGTELWRRAILHGADGIDLTQLVNSRQWVFDDVHPQYTVSLVALRRGGSSASSVVHLRGPFRSGQTLSAGLRLEPLPISGAEMAGWSHDCAFPLLPNQESLGVFLKLRRHLGLTDPAQPWGVRVYNELHSTAAKRDHGGPIETSGAAPTTAWPVYKGDSFSIWEPDTGVYYGWADPAKGLRYIMEKRARQLRTRGSPFFGLPAELARDSDLQPPMRPRVAWRKVGRATDRRSFYASVIPPNVFVADHCYCLLFEGERSARTEAFVAGVMSSVPFDWHARLWVEANFTAQIVKPFPLPGGSLNTPLGTRLTKLSGRLTAVDDRYADWAAEVGVPVGSVTDPAEKGDLIAELDAAVALLYGLDEPDVRIIFETFHEGWDYRPRLDAVLSHFRRLRA